MASRSLGTLTIDILARTGAFIAGLDKAAREARDKLTKMEKYANAAGRAIGTGLRFAAVGAAAAGTAIATLTIQSINYADELDELSQKLGISAEQLSKWAYVANLSGTDIDTVARSVNLLGKNLAAAADPTSKMGELFASLGIQVKDAAGNLRSAEDVLPELADRFKALDNQTTETALAMQLFGRSGAELLEFLNRGSDGIKTLEDELASLGGVISNETAAAAADFKDELDRLKIVGQGLGLQIAQQLLPTLIETAQEFRALVKDGNLVANVVSLISAAMNAGVGAIKTYNAAVEITTASIEAMVRASQGAIEITANLATFGFADGSIVGGLRKQAKAVDDLVEAREKAIKQRDAAPGATVTLIDPGEGLEAWKQEKALAEDAIGLQDRINKLLEGSAESTKRATGAKKEKNTVDREALELQRELERQAQEEADMYRESLRNIQDGIDRGKEVAAGLEFEIELMGLSNREREKAIALSQLSNEALIGEGQRIKDNIDLLYDQMERVELMDGFRDSFQNFFTDVIGGTMSVADAFKSMLDDINAMILQRIAENWVEQLFGAMGTTQGGAAGGDWLSMFAGLFGGGRANGGWANANTLYEVNERGLEMATVNGRDYMLTGNSPVQVTPNHKLGGGVQQSNTFVIQGRIDRRTQDQIVQDVGRKTQTAMARNG